MITIVLDSNIIISALIKESSTRKIIIKTDSDLLIPSFSLSEIMKYKELILRKSGLNEEEFKIVLDKIFRNITIIPKKEYHSFIKKAKKLIIDKKDVAFLALALSIPGSIIWSDDKHLKQQEKIKVLTTKEIIKTFE